MDTNINLNLDHAAVDAIAGNAVAPRAVTQAAADLQTALVAAAGVHWDQGQPLEVGTITVDETPHGQIAYPWNPADPAADAFFEQAEQAAGLEVWQMAEIAERATSFFAQVDRLWATMPAMPVVTNSLQSRLVQRFALRVPENLLAAIAQQAQSVVSSSLSLADQLVHCVEEVLPAFAVEDLQVLARPLAFAMRGEAEATPWDLVLQNVRPVSWEALSEIEQARISLAIARYAIAECDPASHP
jgi:hypothetical protein